MFELKKGRVKTKYGTRTSLLKRVLVFVLIFTNIANFTTFVQAGDKWPAINEIEADSYIVINKNTGETILEKDSGKKINPASLTKVLTAIIGIENLDLNQEITVSKAAASLSDNESKLDLIAGEKLTFNELLNGLLISSGNDAAISIAEAVSGNIASFSILMNKRAKEIGAKSSSWSNPQGITATTHYTTAYDLSILTRYALQNEVFKKVVNTSVFSMATTNKHPFNGWNILENTNKILRYQDIYFASDLFNSVSGVKTGTTTAAGSNLIATAKTNSGVELICVINGVRDDNSKNLWAFTRTLFEEAAKKTTGSQNSTVVDNKSQNKSSISSNDSLNSSFSEQIKSSQSVANSISNNNNSTIIIILLCLIVIIGICCMFLLVKKPRVTKKSSKKMF